LGAGGLEPPQLMLRVQASIYLLHPRRTGIAPGHWIVRQSLHSLCSLDLAKPKSLHQPYTRCTKIALTNNKDHQLIIAHLTGEDLDKAIIKLYNLTDETEVKKMKSMAPKQCPACATYNIHTNEFCAACLTPLSEDAVMSMDMLKDDVISNPKALAAFVQQIAAKQVAMTMEAEWKKATPLP
jgi:hypothetical protein